MPAYLACLRAGPPSRQPSRRSSSKRPITGGRSSASWWLTAAVVFKASLGLGVLALPSSFARLGWLPSIACLGALTLGVLYIGTLYRRLFMPQRLPDGECGTPSSTSSRAQVHGNVPLLHEVGARAAGAVGQWAVALTVYSVIFLLPALFHITAVEALEQVGLDHAFNGRPCPGCIRA